MVKKVPQKMLKTTNLRILNIKMSTKWVQFLHLACQREQLASSSVTPLFVGDTTFGDDTAHFLL